MIKVLFLPLNYSDSIQDGMYDAFRDLGCNLDIFDYYWHFENTKRRNIRHVRNELVDVVKNIQPDLIHMQIQHTNVIDATTVNRMKVASPHSIISNYTIDCRSIVPGTYRGISQACDFNFISSTGQLDMFRQTTGKDVKFLQVGYNPKLYYPAPVKKESYDWDVVFIANQNAREKYPDLPIREETARLLRNTFGKRFGLFGSGWARDIKANYSANQRTLAEEIYHKSYCSVSVSCFNNISHYFSDRILMAMACGRPVVSLKYPQWEDYFANKGDLVMADSPTDIVNQVRWLLDNPDHADLIGENGAQKVFAERSYLSVCRELLHVIGLMK